MVKHYKIVCDLKLSLQIKEIKRRVSILKRESVVIYYSLLDRRTPFLAKVMGFLAIGYLLSPIDLIPDFIPVIGMVDDLIIVPILITSTVKLIPDYIIEDIKSSVDTDTKLHKKWYYAIPIILFYILILFWLFSKILKLF